jgi:hypothetical protein
MTKLFLPQVSWILVSSALLCLAPIVNADDPTVEIVTQNSPAAAEQSTGSWLPSFPRVEVYTQFHAGYDDNAQTSRSGAGSLFTSENVTLSYVLPSRSTQVSITAGIGVTDYIEQRTDTTAFFDLSLARNLTRRLALNASIDGAYTSEPNFNEDVGPDRFQGSYFNINDKIWASYELSRRISTVSSYSFHLVRYEDKEAAFFTDRDEHSFAEQLRYILTRTTTLTAQYNFLLVDYVTYPLDSTTHYALAGIEHTFSPDLRAQFQAGASLRSYDNGGNETDPDFQGSLDYTIGNRTSLSWTGSYSVEAPTERNVVSTTAFRTGLQLTHSFTGRVSLSLGAAYHHDENQQGLTFLSMGPTFDEDTFEVSLGLHYQLSRRLSFDFGIERSEIASGLSTRDYSRNHYSMGLSYTF